MMGLKRSEPVGSCSDASKQLPASSLSLRQNQDARLTYYLCWKKFMYYIQILCWKIRSTSWKCRFGLNYLSKPWMNSLNERSRQALPRLGSTWYVVLPTISHAFGIDRHVGTWFVDCGLPFDFIVCCVQGGLPTTTKNQNYSTLLLLQEKRHAPFASRSQFSYIVIISSPNFPLIHYALGLWKWNLEAPMADMTVS